MERADPSEIRVRNGSDVAFTDVIVGRNSYGNIEPGRTTEYQTWQRAYRYSNFSFMAESKVYNFVPNDYTGEVPLGQGKFTYVLTFGGIEVERDTK